MTWEALLGKLGIDWHCLGWGQINIELMAGAFWKGSTRLASPSSLIRWSAWLSSMYSLGSLYLLRSVSIPSLRSLCITVIFKLEIPFTLNLQDKMSTDNTSPTVQSKRPKSWNSPAQRCISAGARQFEHYDWVSGAEYLKGVSTSAKSISQGHSCRTGSWFGASGQSVGGSSQVTFAIFVDPMLTAKSCETVAFV